MNNNLFFKVSRTDSLCGKAEQCFGEAVSCKLQWKFFLRKCPESVCSNQNVPGAFCRGRHFCKSECSSHGQTLTSLPCHDSEVCISLILASVCGFSQTQSLFENNMLKEWIWEKDKDKGQFLTTLPNASTQNIYPIRQMLLYLHSSQTQ